MIEGKTKSGFEYKISKARLDNYELVEAIGDLDTNPLAITKVVDLLLGKENKDSLKEHVRDDDGIVSVTSLSNELTEIFTSHNETKKS
ncbi:hypothetical protein CWR48_04310 [Oceanobacillus arenosus]|uniref:Phage protein n=1 Tax=Oceanobacillus arenosus TaxID=1229153 RepID=A0A3D8PZ17_9BACI|nr:hypothetical protein [Oceanobacillus arenosus]RDW21042.1 hypothetical protein CWR48_04310 [Oceanobacillus arenosus]